MDNKHLITWMMLCFIMSNVTPTPVVGAIWFATGVWMFLFFMYLSHGERKAMKAEIKKIDELVKLRNIRAKMEEEE